MVVLPSVTDDDITWACRVMGLPSTAFTGNDGTDPRSGVLKRLDTIDVEACPGSGKTTLLVAKLAILARRWPSARAGMCVLSHTNAARDEIAHRLSSCPEGALLMGYPHFVGTIHAFANEFLALPYLRSNKNKINIIDDDAVVEYRWSKVPYKTKLYLDRKNAGKGRSFMRYDRDDYSSEKMRSLKENTDTFKLVNSICKETSGNGYFCYDELFVWAGRLLAERPDVTDGLRQRFPLLFIDEVQDNDEKQSNLLNRIFLQGDKPSVRQRFGDSNQAIYQSSSVTCGAVTDPFPGPNKVDLPNSFRFGSIIADLSDPLGVVPQGLIGLGPNGVAGSSKVRNPTIFLFDERSVHSVLPEYSKYLIEQFSDEELNKGLFTAIAGVHKADEKGQIPRWMGHYAPSYNPDVSYREPFPKYFNQYVAVGWREAKRVQRTMPIVRATAQGMLELLQRAGHAAANRRSFNPHQDVLSYVNDVDMRKKYCRLVDLFIQRAGAITDTAWNKSVAGLITSVAYSVVGNNAKSNAIQNFLKWNSEDSENNGKILKNASNLFIYPDNEQKVAVKLGSIHSVKGETHWATLVLDTYYHKHHFSELKPWLLGLRSGGKKPGGKKEEGSRMLGRLRLHYVGMTRPSYLLCLAMKASTFSEEERVVLQKRGWLIRDCPTP